MPKPDPEGFPENSADPHIEVPETGHTHDASSDTTDIPVIGDGEPAASSNARLRLDFHAVSDVGRVRKDNQDSGYAGPWLLSVCDGVGGAARGDIASSTTVNELRHLDEPPTSTDLLDRITNGLNEAHVAIGAQVDADPSINGTSTTATVALFDGSRLGLGHVGDSRAYLLRSGELSQLTNDHTFVQSLIDEGRITEEEARVHPHRNLILKALDGFHDVDPDLFTLELVAGDRLFLCSDGACGVLDDRRIAEILTEGTPEAAAFEMVQASLEAGSSDNVTCVVADVEAIEAEASSDTAGAPAHPAPQVVGAAAELKQRRSRPLLRAHRAADTGELEPISAEIPEGIGYAIPSDPPIDAEAMRYAPQAPPRFIWVRRLLVLAVLAGLVWIGVGTAYWWSQRQYYVGEDDGVVVIYRGVEVPGLSSVYERSSLSLADLPDAQQGPVEDGIPADDLTAAREKIEQLADEVGDEPGATIDDDTSKDTGKNPSKNKPTSPAPSDGSGNDFGIDSSAPADNRDSSTAGTTGNGGS